MPDDKFLKAMIRDLKANRDTYNTKGKLTSFLNGKITANIEQKQQEIEMKKIEIKMKKIEKIEEIAEPFLKELCKKEKHKLTKEEEQEQEEKFLKKIVKRIREKNIDVYNSNKDKDLVIKNIVKTIYQRPCKVEKNPVSEMYYISKNNAKKKNNTPCNLKKPLVSMEKVSKSCS